MTMELDKERITRALTPIIGMLKMFSNLLSEVADIEKSEGKKIDEILKELLTPTMLVELSKKMTPDLYGEFIASLLRLASVTSTVTNPMLLPAEEKKKLASEIEEIVNDLEKVFNKLKEAPK